MDAREFTQELTRHLRDQPNIEILIANSSTAKIFALSERANEVIPRVKSL